MSVPQSAENIVDVDTVVISTAIREDNPELAAARAQGLPVLHRSEALAAVAARELNYLAQRTRRQCGLALTMGADVRDLLASQYGKTSGMQAMRDYCETVYRAIAEYVLDATRRPPTARPPR